MSWVRPTPYDDRENIANFNIEYAALASMFKSEDAFHEGLKELEDIDFYYSDSLNIFNVFKKLNMQGISRADEGYSEMFFECLEETSYETYENFNELFYVDSNSRNMPYYIESLKKVACRRHLKEACSESIQWLRKSLEEDALLEKRIFSPLSKPSSKKDKDEEADLLGDFFRRAMPEAEAFQEFFPEGKNLLADKFKKFKAGYQAQIDDIDKKYNRNLGYQPIDELVNQQLELIRQVAGGEAPTGLNPGLPSLNKMTTGFQKGDLIILAARPSMGKTALALNFTTNLSIHKKETVVFFSLEMDQESLIMRLLAEDAGVSFQNLRTGNLEREDWDRLIDATARVGSGWLVIRDKPSMTLTQIKEQARQIKKERGKISLIIVDYLQLIASEQKRNSNREQEIATISRGLKAIAKEIDCPIIALSQLSRAVEQRENKTPLLSDLRESGAIEQDADLIMFLYRDEYYHRDDPSVKGLAKLIIAKQRNGPVGTIDLRWDDQIMEFQDLS